MAPYVDLIVKFRDSIKELAQTKAPTGEFFKVLDSIRDEALPELGVRLEDKKKGESAIWKFAPREELLKEIEMKKLEEEKKAELKKKKLE